MLVVILLNTFIFQNSKEDFIKYFLLKWCIGLIGLRTTAPINKTVPWNYKSFGGKEMGGKLRHPRESCESVFPGGKKNPV